MSVASGAELQDVVDAVDASNVLLTSLEEKAEKQIFLLQVVALGIGWIVGAAIFATQLIARKQKDLI